MSAGGTLLGDRKWVIVAIISLLGAVIPVALTLMQRDIKAFTYEVISKATVLDLGDPVLSQVTAHFQGRELKRLTVWTVKLTNTGSVPILRHDFDSSITLTLPGKVSLLHSTVIESKPFDFRPKITQVANAISIEPALWNPTDSLSLQILADGSSSRMDVFARIAGIRQAESSTVSIDRVRRRAYTAIALSPFGGLGYGFFLMAGMLGFRRRATGLAAVCVTTSLFMGATGGLMLRYAESFFRFGMADWMLLVVSLVPVTLGTLLALRFVPSSLLWQAGGK